METATEFPTMILKESIGFADHRFQWASRKEAEAKETLKFASFLEDEETCTNGVDVRDRAKALGDPAGWIHGQRMLEQDQRAQQENIPEDAIPVELRERILVFAGMLRYRPGNFRLVAYLYWDKNNQKWAIGFFWLGNRFSKACLLVLLVFPSK